MKLFIVLICCEFMLSCGNKRTPETVIASPETKVDEKNLSKYEFESYQEIKHEFEKNHFCVLKWNSLISNFKDFHDTSVWLDSVLLIEKQMNKKIENLTQQRDSLSKISVFAYFNSINLPKLDSITYKNWEPVDHDYQFDFTSFDEKIIPKKGEWDWYLSKQYQNDFVCISVCHYIDCESYISFYIIDNTFKAIDELSIMNLGGCEPDLGDIDFKYQDFIINYDGGYYNYRSVLFENDSIFTVISEDDHYFLENIKTKKITEEVGTKTNKKYKLNSSGKFELIEDESFEKEYVKPFWDYVYKNV